MKWQSGPVAQWPKSTPPLRHSATWPLTGPLGHSHGQSTVEIALLIAAVAAALTAMGIYLQRGYQGYVRSAGQTQGIQFDPTKPYSGSQQLNAYTRNQSIDIISGEASVPVIGGTLPGRTLTTKVRTVTGWDVQRDATYQAK